MSVAAVHMRWALDTDQLTSIEIGLCSKLRSAQIPEAFIERNLEDLLQQAVAEYANAREHGTKVTNACGWIVHAAYLRAIDQLRHEEHEMEGTTEDIAADATDETTPLPDEEALGHIEAEQLHRAISRLSVSQRQALSLYYFEDKTTRDGADALGWTEPTFRRRRDAAIRNLRQRFGVTVPEFDIGLAAWLSLTSTDSRFASIASTLTGGLETVRAGALAAIDRTRDLVTRLISSGGGETAMGISGPAGKAAAGVCATAIAACTATGVIGPGVAGVDLIDNNTNKRPVERHLSKQEPARPQAVNAPSPRARNTVETSPSQTTQDRNTDESTTRASTHNERVRRARRRAASQFGVESGAAPSSPATAPPPPPTTQVTPVPSPAPTADQSAQQQFGLP